MTVGGEMKCWLVSITLVLVFLSPATQADERKIVLRDLLPLKFPGFQNALREGIDATSGVQGAGRGSFPFGEADINGDGLPELLVAYDNSYFGGSAGNYPVEIFSPQPAGGWRWLGRVWGRENHPLVLGRPSGGWSTIRFERHVYCWKNLKEGEPPPETGYAGHRPQGGMYVYCYEK